MEDSTIKIDKAAIGLSMLCIAHCLLTPIAMIMPALGATFLDDEDSIMPTFLVNSDQHF